MFLTTSGKCFFLAIQKAGKWLNELFPKKIKSGLNPVA